MATSGQLPTAFEAGSSSGSCAGRSREICLQVSGRLMDHEKDFETKPEPEPTSSQLTFLFCFAAAHNKS